jgi:hypothetical protein
MTNRLEIGELSIAINPEKWDTRLVIVWYFVQWFLIKREKKKNFLWPASLFLTLKSLNCYLLKENENFSKQITDVRWWQNPLKSKEQKKKKTIAKQHAIKVNCVKSDIVMVFFNSLFFFIGGICDVHFSEYSIGYCGRSWIKCKLNKLCCSCKRLHKKSTKIVALRST